MFSIDQRGELGEFGARGHRAYDDYHVIQRRHIKQSIPTSQLPCVKVCAIENKNKKRVAEKKESNGCKTIRANRYPIVKKRTYSSPIKNAPSVNATAQPDSGWSPNHGSADDAAMVD